MENAEPAHKMNDHNLYVEVVKVLGLRPEHPYHNDEFKFWIVWSCLTSVSINTH